MGDPEKLEDNWIKFMNSALIGFVVYGSYGALISLAGKVGNVFMGKTYRPLPRHEPTREFEMQTIW